MKAALNSCLLLCNKGVDYMVKIMLDPGHGGGTAHNRGFKQVDNLPYCN